MKYDVTHSCGHTETISLFGPGDQRRRTIAALEHNGICSACKAAANSAVSAQNKAAGMVELIGTPKQVAWAETIRAKMMPGLQTVKNNALALPDNHAHKKTLLALIDECINNTRASWWIDNRNYTTGEAIYKNELLKYAKAHSAK